jgi:hypothetical protein
MYIYISCTDENIQRHVCIYPFPHATHTGICFMYAFTYTYIHMSIHVHMCHQTPCIIPQQSQALSRRFRVPKEDRTEGMTAAVVAETEQQQSSIVFPRLSRSDSCSIARRGRAPSEAYLGDILLRCIQQTCGVYVCTYVFVHTCMYIVLYWLRMNFI